MNCEIILGSSSKWRKKVIESLGYNNIRTLSPDIDEKAIRDPDAVQLTLKLARAKAAALLQKIPPNSNVLIITADQVILCNGEIREKPRDAEECRNYLRSYAQYPAQCVNGVVVTNVRTGRQVQGTDIATQYFRPLSEEAIEELIRKGDVLHCAGGFTVECMEPYLLRCEGETEAVIGLPKSLTLRLLKEAQQQ